MNIQQLDERNQAIRNKLAEKRMVLIQYGRPLVGDIVLWPNGEKRRVAHDWDEDLQTTKEGMGSFYATSSGRGDHSGTLQPAVLLEFFEATETIEEAGFWFFSHGVAGAGRGVHCTLPCRVWNLKPFTRTREQAEVHPKAVHSKQFWESQVNEYEAVLESIMNPKVLTNPDYY